MSLVHVCDDHACIFFVCMNVCVCVSIYVRV